MPRFGIRGHPFLGRRFFDKKGLVQHAHQPLRLRIAAGGLDCSNDLLLGLLDHFFAQGKTDVHVGLGIAAVVST